jgi:hypothetical protein
MRPRTELLLFVSALVALSVLVARNSRMTANQFLEQRPTTYSTEPNGAQGLADGLMRLHVKVERLRRLGTPDTRGGALAVLEPSVPLTPASILALADSGANDPLVLVGPATGSVMRCFGYQTELLPDSSAVRVSGDAGTGAEPEPRVRSVLRSTDETVVVDSSRASDADVARCDVPVLARIDTLLATVHGALVAVRLTARRREVVLVADPNLVRNRTLKETAAGPVVLGWFARYRVVWFDEYHHGYATGGSLARATWDWSLRSPWGWLGWQLAIVGLIALFASGVRFGPPLERFSRTRRSALEHVRALAVALRAAGGHGLAVELMIAGFRRRLVPGRTKAPDRRGSLEWLRSVATGARSPRARDIAGRLERLASGQPGEPDVLEAANLVEELWTELRS